MIIHCIQAQLGPRYATLIDAVGWTVWTAEWRIDPTGEMRFYRGVNPENRAIKKALEEGYIEDGTSRAY